MSRFGRRAAGAGAIAWLSAFLILVGPARAAGPTITIEPAGDLSDADQTITVRGTGFDASANGGVGIYVVFGPLADAPAYYTEADRYGAARWVHPGASVGPGQAELAADGSFETTLDLRPRYVDGQDRAIDCVATPCHVITMAAHGAPDRSQDTFTPVTFRAGASPAGVVPATGTGGPGSLAWVGLLGALAIVGVVGLLVAATLRRRRQGDREADPHRAGAGLGALEPDGQAQAADEGDHAPVRVEGGGPQLS